MFLTPPIGLPVSMLFGFFFLKRRYSLVQVVGPSCFSVFCYLSIYNKFSVIMVSFGVTIATFSRPPSNAPSQSNSDVRKYSIGIVMLVLSLLCTGFLGMLQEKTYQRYGPCWKEGVFYTVQFCQSPPFFTDGRQKHCLSLPVFLFLVQDVKQGLASLSEPTEASAAGMAWLILAGNLVTQLICVSGVNRLTSVSFIRYAKSLAESTTASIVCVNEFGVNDKKSNQFMLQCMVVWKRVEYATWCWCLHGVPG